VVSVVVLLAFSTGVIVPRKALLEFGLNVEVHHASFVVHVLLNPVVDIPGYPG